MTQLNILLDRSSPLAVYAPGEEVVGNVELVIQKPHRFREISIQLLGYCRVFWVVPGNNRVQSQTHSDEEEYINERMTVCRSQDPKAPLLHLSPGSYTYPFRFLLPTDIPGTFRGESGVVAYFLIATLVMPIDMPCLQTNRDLYVTGILDLNTEPGLKAPVDLSDEKTVCCFSCLTGSVSVTMKLPRLGFVPREDIVFSSEVVNDSGRTVKYILVKLKQHTIFISTTSSRVTKETVQILRYGPVEPGCTRVYPELRLPIPIVPTSNLPGCKIIKNSYYLKVKGVISGPSTSLKMEKAITIGNIPLENVTSTHEPMPIPIFAYSPAPNNKDRKEMDSKSANHKNLHAQTKLSTRTAPSSKPAHPADVNQIVLGVTPANTGVGASLGQQRQPVTNSNHGRVLQSKYVTPTNDTRAIAVRTNRISLSKEAVQKPYRDTGTPYIAFNRVPRGAVVSVIPANTTRSRQSGCKTRGGFAL